MGPDYYSSRQSRQVDRRAIDELGMLSLVLMENAGRCCADLLCGLDPRGPVVICCGRGNNAGDGFVMARHLLNRRVPVEVLLWSDPDKLRGDAEHNYRILRNMRAPLTDATLRGERDSVERSLRGARWVVDALLGTGATGAPRPPLDVAIRRLNETDALRLAIDLPSGLDCDSGEPADPTFRADHTCTFVARKTGFANPASFPFVGRVHTADIGIHPRFL